MLNIVHSYKNLQFTLTESWTWEGFQKASGTYALTVKARKLGPVNWDLPQATQSENQNRDILQPSSIFSLLFHAENSLWKQRIKGVGSSEKFWLRNLRVQM